jgi:hypothetical protein
MNIYKVKSFLSKNGFNIAIKKCNVIETKEGLSVSTDGINSFILEKSSIGVISNLMNDQIGTKEDPRLRYYIWCFEEDIELCKSTLISFNIKKNRYVQESFRYAC